MLPLFVAHEQEAARRLPQEVVDYYAAGSGEETAVAEASAAWERFRLRPRVLRDVSTLDLTTTLLGAPLVCPIGVAPMAFQRLAHPDAEPGTARAVGTIGGLMVLSTRSSTSIEEVAAA